MTDFLTCPGGHAQMESVGEKDALGIVDVPKDVDVESMESPVKCPDCGYVEDAE